jgi:hypothetical protein
LGKDRDGSTTADSGREEQEGGKGEFATPEEWFKAEEAALKALEMEVAERRRLVSAFLVPMRCVH